MRFVPGVAALAALVASGSAACAAEPLLHSFASVALAPDGSRVVAIERTDAPVDGEPTHEDLVMRPVTNGAPIVVALPCGSSPDCVPSAPTWSPDGRRIAFVLRAPKSERRSLYTVDANGSGLTLRATLEGAFGQPRFSPRGDLAVLATAGAKKEIGATQAGAPIVGEIGAASDEQRIAIVGPNGALRWASPPETFVYEYDWKPDGSGFVATAARGNGDDNYWIAKLYAFDAASGNGTLLYAPSSPQQQLAHPVVSPDGRYVAFIGGLMSDFGSVGGEIFVVPSAGGTARDLTPGRDATPTSLAWECANDTARERVFFSELQGGSRRIRVVDAAGHTDAAVSDLDLGSGALPSRACDAQGDAAAVVQTFAKPPEIVVRRNGRVAAITHANESLSASVDARSLTWTSDGYRVQGYLLGAPHVGAGAKHPLILAVHGGPAAAWEENFVGRGTVRDFLRAGYFVFEPNPRGSFGQGEAFTRANVRDFGYGDLRDDLAGIDAAEKLAPIDDARLGITGGSYGGFMSMWAVTQTTRFKAAVAGAGISDWISYYGENGIDEWMIPYFGASAYDDPAPYLKSSPLTFIKNVKTPTFAFVGERDVECPAPQSLEFWHALEALGVPTQLVIYEGEGHGIRTPAHRADVTKRTLAWFAKYL